MAHRQELFFATHAAAQIRDQVRLVALDVKGKESRALKARFAAIMHSAQSALDRLEAEERAACLAGRDSRVV